MLHPKKNLANFAKLDKFPLRHVCVDVHDVTLCAGTRENTTLGHSKRNTCMQHVSPLLIVLNYPIDGDINVYIVYTLCICQTASLLQN